MPSFFRLAKNKQFNYAPRYYNEQEEEMQKRKERIAREIEAEEAGSNDNRIPLIRGAIKSHYGQNIERHKRKSNVRLLIVLVILLFMAYYLLIR
ncbi:hypothetical protein ACFLQ9_01845 [Bacteroidota bacterium]